MLLKVITVMNVQFATIGILISVLFMIAILIFILFMALADLMQFICLKICA